MNINGIAEIWHIRYQPKKTHQFVMAMGKCIQDFIYNSVRQERSHCQLYFTV